MSCIKILCSHKSYKDKTNMDKHCPECGGVDHTKITECPHLTPKELKLWEKARKYGHETGYMAGYDYGYKNGQQNIRDNS